MSSATYMMAVNAIFHVALLPVGAGIEARQKGDSNQLVLGRLVPMLKHAGGTLAAGTAQIMIIAEFVVVFAFLDIVQRGLGYLEWRV